MKDYMKNYFVCAYRPYYHPFDSLEKAYACHDQQCVQKVSPSHRYGFTLIELLTVIAIIGILAAILIPVVGKVRDSGRAAVCMSNMRQLTLGMLMYADENNGVLPTGSSATGRSAQLNPTDWIHWREGERGHLLEHSALVPYVGGAFTPELFRCPSDEHIANGTIRNGYAYSFALNYHLAEASQLGGRIYNVRDPSRVIMMVEQDNPPDETAWMHSEAVLTKRHGSKGHVTFVDGHVERVHPHFAKHPANYDPFYAGREYAGPR